MKILFVACTDDPFDHNAGSGKDYELYRGLERHQAEMVLAGPFPFSQTFVERVYRKIHSLLFKRRPLKYTESYLRNAAKQVDEMIHIHQPDVIFSKYLPIIAKLKTDVPIVVFSDTTLAGSQRQWPIFTELAYRLQLRAEKIAYGMAARIIVHSEWCADDLVNVYHQSREKILVIPDPASIPEQVIPTNFPEKDFAPLKLLLVGREWERKGVDIAFDVVHQLNQLGHKSVLRIVGLSGESDDQIQFMGLYNKTIPQQLDEYVANYMWANFLLHPARFEAGGVVLAEAAAFGVPGITNAVGGMATSVADKISGIVLPMLSPAEAYVQTFIDYMNDPDKYHQLCRTTRERYEKELNWGVISKKVYAECEKAIGKSGN